MYAFFPFFSFGYFDFGTHNVTENSETKEEMYHTTTMQDANLQSKY